MKYVVPTLHPSFILRGTRRMMGLLRFDIRRTVALARGWKPEWSDSEFILAPSAERVVRVLQSMRGKRVGWDIETDGQHPLVCDVRCIGFYDGSVGICVPLLYRTGEKEEGPDRKMRAVWKPYFQGPQLVTVLKAIMELLNDSSTTPIAQNGQYDKLCMKARLGLDLRYAEDTMLAHHVIVPYLPHGLGFLATLYTDITYYKASEGGDAWSAGTDHELWLYCCRDCKVTWLAWDKIRSEVRERVADQAIYALDKRSAEQAERWKHVGMGVDVEQLKRYQVHYDAIAVNSLSKLRESVKNLNEQKAVNEEALEALLKVLGDKLSDEDLILGPDGEIVERAEQDVFNPGSLKQLRLALSAFNIPLTELTATGDVSTSKEMLLGARKMLIDQRAKPDDPRLAFLDYLFSWRESKKLRSTYLTPEKGAPEIITPQMIAERRVHCLVPYGELPRVHPTFNVHITPTGRLSSSNPNAQNQPPELRAQIQARESHSLVMGDWDSGELRMQAYASGDKVLLEGFKAYDAGTGLKLHILNASAIFGLPATEDFEKIYPGPYRASKVFVYACAYGAGPHTVFDKVRDEMPDMQWPVFLKCFDNYKKARPGLFGFLKSVVDSGMKNGYLDSQILGRRTHYFEPAMGFGGSSTEASAMQNFNFQAGLAEVVTLANMRIIDEVLPKYRKRLKGLEVCEQLVQVHDELMFEVPDRMAEDFSKDYKAVAERCPKKGFEHWYLPVSMVVRKRWKPAPKGLGSAADERQRTLDEKAKAKAKKGAHA